VLRVARQATKALAVLAAVVFPLTLKLSGQNLASALLVYVIAALSITVLTGYAGQVSFGQWAIVGFGALLGGGMATQHGLPFLPGLVVIPLAGSLLAVVIGLPALRIRGIFLGVTTLAFGIAAQAYLYQRPLFHMDAPVDRPSLLSSELSYYYFCLAVVVVTMLGLRNLRTSAVGRAMVAVRDNDRAAASYGVDLVRAKLAAFAVSGFLAALAGYLYVYNAGKLDAGSFPPLISLLLFSAVVIGGLGSQVGAVLAALYFRGVSYFLPGWAQFLATSVGLLLILLFLPGGIGSLFFGLRDRALRWYAGTRSIRVPSLVADTREAVST
jgi:branched-chain amino acid transport system permease protein